MANEEQGKAADGAAKDSVVAEAQERWKFCENYERNARKLYVEDMKFANGDSDNNWQWPADILSDRNPATGGTKPTLTINKVRQHNFLITNEAKKNKPAIKYSPVGNRATKESANIWNGLARHIEQISNAQAHYDTATKHMVQAGWGYCRVRADYKDSASFDQELFILPVEDALLVWLDPMTIQPDQIDAKYGFVLEDISRDLAKVKYERYADYLGQTWASSDAYGWVDENNIRIAEYYRIVTTRGTLWMYTGADDKPVFIREAGLSKPLLAELKAKPGARSRVVYDHKLEWYLIIGNEIAEKNLDMPGRYIPIAKFEGERRVIDGKFDCPGHTRALKDCQRMYNYWSSGAVEYGALQTKTPWVASSESIEGHETDWNAANIQNKSVLTYNALADDGVTPLAPPQRIPPPISAPLALDGMRIASEEMMSVSGQYQASFGAPSNERSGKAINERQQQGETATYHYIDAQALAVRKIGKIIYDMALKIYDSRRLISILQEDGKSLEVQLDPAAKQAYAERQAENQQAVERIFNPAVGDYEVDVDVGPAFGTRRKESFNAFMELLGQAPQLIPLLADLLFLMGEFPLAEEAADRLRRLVPPHALGVGPSPQEQQLQQQLENMQTMLRKMLDEGAKKDLAAQNKSKDQAIGLFNAFTKRLQVIAQDKQISMDTSQIQELVRQTLAEAMGQAPGGAGEGATGIPALGAPAPLDGSLPAPQPGSRMGADGAYYARDYAQSDQFRRLT